MKDTELQYYRKIGAIDKLGRMKCFTFTDYYGNLNDHLKGKSVDPYTEGFELTQLVVDTLLPFVLSRIKDRREYVLCKIVLANIYDTYSVYDVAKELGISSNVEFTLGKIRSLVFIEHFDYYKELNNL